MAKRSWAVVALAVALLAVAGCGGDDDGGSTTTETTTETSTSADTRLTEEQWASYQDASASFVEARDAATEKLDTCPDTSADEYSACLGTTLDDLETAATDLGDTLSGFEGTVTGDCATSITVFEGYVAPYVNAVQMLQSAIDEGSVSEIPSIETQLQTLSQGGSEERQSFEETCAPA